MGTNYYLQKPLNLEEKKEVIDDIIFCRYDEVRDKLPKDIHIGKKSYGWKFLWNANRFKYFQPNIESIMTFLKSGQIKDEYGRWLTFDEFVEVLNSQIQDGYDLESYCKANPQEYHSYLFRKSSDVISMVNEFELNVNSFNEFYIDNLRFTTEDEFG